MSEHPLLLTGHDKLKLDPAFKLEGRQNELMRMSSILMRHKANSVLLVGPGGSGASAICMGLEACKQYPDTPFDIISKRFFWLITDNLFASGEAQSINENYRKLTAALTRTPEAVLIIDDMKDFIEAARNNHCYNLINALMHDIKVGKFQVILEAREDDLDMVIKCHSDMREAFTMLDIGEPTGEELMSIVANTAKRLEAFHGINISPTAIETAVELTSKYRAEDLSLSRAQPEASLTLLDRALTRYRQDAHSTDPKVAKLQAEVAKIEQHLQRESLPTDTQDRTALQERLAQVQSALASATSNWQQRKAQVHHLQSELINGEAFVREKNAELEAILSKEAEERQHAQAKGVHAQAPEVEKKVGSFVEFARDSGYESEQVTELRQKIARYDAELAKLHHEYASLMEAINRDLLLTHEHVLNKFSVLAKIPVNKLNQDEREKLLHLGSTLKSQVFDQDHIVDKVESAVISANAGLSDDDKPQFSFMFLGPSGVGKTHIAKVLATALYGDANAMIRFDMSEYMEKHAAAKLIGAPPGYEGFEAGGILTNAIRRRPKSLILFDEIEKAHPSVFDLFLQILDDARLTDNLGRTASFAETGIIMTTNVGTPHFLTTDISFDEAQARALTDLEAAYRPEFLNRFNGRRNIQCFHALSHSAIERIANVDIAHLNRKIAKHNFTLDITSDEIRKLVQDLYKPVEGARGIKGYLKDSIEPQIARMILANTEQSGTIQMQYDTAKGLYPIEHRANAPEPPQNGNSVPH